MVERRWLRTLSASELRVVVTALVMLPAVALATRLRGLKWVRRYLEVRRPISRRLLQSLVSSGIEPLRLAELIHGAARESFWKANCLQRSLVLIWALRVQGRSSELCMGVRRDAGSTVPDFHAWVEMDGRVLNDDVDVRSMFLVFEEPTAEVSDRAPR